MPLKCEGIPDYENVWLNNICFSLLTQYAVGWRAGIQPLQKNNSDNSPIFQSPPPHIKTSKRLHWWHTTNQTVRLKTRHYETFLLIQPLNQVSGVIFLNIKMPLRSNFHIFKIKTLRQWKNDQLPLLKIPQKNTESTKDWDWTVKKCMFLLCVCSMHMCRMTTQAVWMDTSCSKLEEADEVYSVLNVAVCDGAV